MESVGALLPELHDLWSKVIATPAFWALDVVSVEPLELGREAINRCQLLNDVTLMGGNRSTTCRRGPRQPVTIGLSIAGAASYPTDPDLTVHWKVPVKEYGGACVVTQIVTLLALGICEEHQIRTRPPHQHHSNRGTAIGTGSGQRHGFGQCLAGCPGVR